MADSRLRMDDLMPADPVHGSGIISNRSVLYHDPAVVPYINEATRQDIARRDERRRSQARQQREQRIYRRQREQYLLERDRLMDLALPRGRVQLYWVGQTASRIVAFGVALVAFICGAYLAAKWSNKRAEGAVGLAANAVAMCIDGFVTSNLLIPSAPRISPWAIFCLDFVMFAAALTAGCLIAVSDKGERGNRPWTLALIMTAAFTILTAVLRIMFLTWSCFDCKRVKKTRQQMQRRSEPEPTPSPPATSEP